MKKYRFLYEGAECEIEWSEENGRIVARRDDGEAAFELHPAFARVGRLNLSYHLYQDGDKIWVWLRGRSFCLQPLSTVAQREAGGAAAAAGDSVSAAMPGKVLEISVKPGQRVKEDDPLLLMESMKMELTIRAPRDGVVAQIPIETGQMVDQGGLLVALEPLDD